jgi:AraC family transcriptional regulator, activator of mtrCDE
MDNLSHLIRALAPAGRVDQHCLLAGIWVAPHPEAPPGHVPYHVILGGKLRLRSARGTQIFEAGDVLVFPHGTGHQLESALLGEHDPAPEGAGEQHFNGAVTEIVARGEGPVLDMLCGKFIMGETGSSLLRSLPDVLHIRVGERTPLFALIQLMRSESAEPKPGSAALIDELSSALFTLLLRRLMAEERLTGTVLALLADPRMSHAVEAVLLEPAHAWTVATMAERAHVSRATFARRFAQLGGLSPLEWVGSVRMELAARLLVREGLPANQVAERCGYASEAAFGRVFKKHYQSGPGAYRRSRLKQMAEHPPGT